MPIKGMTHQQAQFPEIGQLRKGGEKQTRKRRDGSEYTIWGKDLDHFRFTSEIPEVVAAFEAVYDGQPRMINVLLPFQYVDENWEAWQEEYVAGGLVHRCDGETMVLWQKDDGSYSTEPRPCPYANGKKQRTDKMPGCKPTGRLKVIIPELRRLAYVTVLTNSVHDIRNLDAQLRALESLRQDLRGIPLQLRRSAKTISTPDERSGKRVRRQKWLVSIEAAPQWVSLQLTAQEAAAVPQLPEGVKPFDYPGASVVDGLTGEILDDGEWDEDAFDAGEDEPEPTPAPKPNSKTTNGHREPLDAETVRKFIRQKAGNWNGERNTAGEPVTEKQVPYVATLMGELFDLDNQMTQKARHDVLRYLIGVDSTHNLMKGEASAIIDWCTKDQDAARIEAARILEATAIEAGQQALDLPPM